MVWMRLAALPTFRKMHAIINSDLQAGEHVTFSVQANFDVSPHLTTLLTSSHYAHARARAHAQARARARAPRARAPRAPRAPCAPCARASAVEEARRVKIELSTDSLWGSGVLWRVILLVKF